MQQKPVPGGVMSALSELLGNAGDRPYKELVEYHVKKTPIERIMLAISGTASLLPDECNKLLIEFIDAANEKLGYDQHFWKFSDIKTAFGKIIQLAISSLPLQAAISCEADAYLYNNHELAFNLFQVITLNFAYSAIQSRDMRKFIGIKKGFFG